MEEDKKLWEFRDDTTENRADFKDQMKAANDKIDDVNRRRASLVAKIESNPPSTTDRLLDKEEHGHHQARHFEMNLDPKYWQQKFLYPFSLDLAPLRLDAGSKQKPEEVVAEKKRQKMMADESVMETTKFQFPVSSIKKP